MADVKISALPLATTPLAGTEVLPIVQSATTDQVTVANLTAGRAVSAASLTLTTPLSAANGGTGITSLGTGVVTALGNAVNGASGIVVEDSNSNVSIAGTFVMGSSFQRNRIINGNMTIDQRATAATTNETYSVDRWKLLKSNDATESAAQNSDAPTGFSYSLRNTVSVGDASIGASQFSSFVQIIEGYNIADFSFGSSAAKSITVSFWVKATQAGTYCCTLYNSDASRCCWKSYTVNNTSGVGWEYKTLTFSGDTTGTWLTTNGAGLSCRFFFALGSTYQGGSDGVWTSSLILGPSGMTNGIAANGNICAITGVQLEVGNTATPFERRQYGLELTLCQRYYWRIYGGSSNQRYGAGYALTTTSANIIMPFPVIMRAAPSALDQSGTASDYLVVFQASATACSAVPTISSCTTAAALTTFYTSALLTAGDGLMSTSNSANSYLGWSAEI